MICSAPCGIRAINEIEKNEFFSCRFKLMARTKYRYKKDGLNTLRYDVVAIKKNPLYTKILVDLREGEERETLKLLVPQC